MAFVLGTLAVGQLISCGDLTPIIWLNAFLPVVAAGVTALVPKITTRSAPSASASPIFVRVLGLLAMPQFRILILVSALVVYGSHAMQDAFAVIRWSEAGLAPSAISLLWSEAVAAEVIVFFVIGPGLVSRIGARGAAALAAAAGIIRWSISGVTTSVLILSVLQPLHGLTFALLHLACMRMMGALIPVGLAATAQAVYAFGSGLVTAALTLLSGMLYATYGGAAFFPMAVCAASQPRLPGSASLVYGRGSFSRHPGAVGLREPGSWQRPTVNLAWRGFAQATEHVDKRQVRQFGLPTADGRALWLSSPELRRPT
jgi:PPP family 3-phenylpropionic acid transporter